MCVCVCRQGGKTGAVQKCTTCRGRGMRIMIRQLAPGMVQQMQSVCTDCNGEGKELSDVNIQVILLCGCDVVVCIVPSPCCFSEPLQAKLSVKKTAVKNARARKW